MASCYILYSSSLNKYYTGATSISVEERILQHNNGYYDRKWTAKGLSWVLYFHIPCYDIKEAWAIEQHIKRMKSKKYIENLKRFPEMVEKLKVRFK